MSVGLMPSGTAESAVTPFETLAHALELPALAAAFASSDDLLLTALRARLDDAGPELSPSEVIHAESLFERIPLAALWRATCAALERLPSASVTQPSSLAAPRGRDPPRTPPSTPRPDAPHHHHHHHHHHRDEPHSTTAGGAAAYTSVEASRRPLQVLSLVDRSTPSY